MEKHEMKDFDPDHDFKCPFCDETFSAYLMYRHFAVAHCDKIEQVIAMMRTLPK